MCGIAASLAGGCEEQIHMMRHRGTETRIIGSVAHRRLPIVGLGDAGAQPRKVGPYTVGFVGEVLDFRDLRPDQESDVDTVVRAWEGAGADGLGRNDGFWSVVVANEVRGTLTFWTDYLGQKPLYYRTDYPSVASEPDAAASFGPATPDELYFSDVVKWGYCPDPTRTPYREVKKTAPGECVQLSRYGLVDTRCSDPICRRGGDLRRELEAAVRRRVLSSDVPVACLLSGGLDSSIVYTLARRYGTVRPYFAYDPEDPGWPEEAEAAQRVVGSVGHLEVVPYDSVTMAEGLDYMQEPLDLGSLLPQVALSKVVREAVCLTGDGADELLGGYSRAARYDSQWSDVFRELPCWHLPRLDRVMMRNTIEVRSPFLARRVVEVALDLPRPQRIGKEILRVLFRGDLPPGIADRKKVPLRTSRVRDDREGNSKELVRMFRERVWG